VVIESTRSLTFKETLRCPTGSLRFKLDNSFSWLVAKTITYKIEVRKDAEAHAARVIAEAEAQERARVEALQRQEAERVAKLAEAHQRVESLQKQLKEKQEEKKQSESESEELQVRLAELDQQRMECASRLETLKSNAISLVDTVNKHSVELAESNALVAELELLALQKSTGDPATDSTLC